MMTTSTSWLAARSAAGRLALAMLLAAPCGGVQAQFPAVGSLDLSGQRAPVRAHRHKLLAQLTGNNALKSDADPGKAAVLPCQPLKGDVVAIRKVMPDPSGKAGHDMAYVSVESGQCRGTSGWVARTSVDAALAPRP